MAPYFILGHSVGHPSFLNPALQALEMLQLAPEECVHVGDDRRNDVWGAR